MATAANNSRVRNNSTTHSEAVHYDSPQNDNDGIGNAPAPAPTAMSPVNNMRTQKQPPQKLFRILNLKGWEKKTTRTWFRTTLLIGLQRVRDGGYDTEVTWKNHTLDQKAKAVKDFQEYIKETTG